MAKPKFYGWKLLAVFWVTIFFIENSGWEAPMGVIQPLVFFVIFFFGALLVRRR